MAALSPFDRDTLQRVASFFSRHSVDAYVVGGTVRDWLLERPSQDLDLAVAGDALSLTRALADELDAAFVPLDEEHATARAVLRPWVGTRQAGEQEESLTDHPSGSPRLYKYIDVAGFRGETLAADLAERDFTVNAMAVPLEDAAAGQLSLIDPLRGQEDLHRGRLRATSESVLRDDPLRLLRAVRLAAELGFIIESETQRWIADLAETIREPAPERIRDELVRLFAQPGTAGYLRLMDDLGLLQLLFPALVACKGVTQPARHQWDAFEHSLVAVDRIDRVLDVVGVLRFEDPDEPGSNLELHDALLLAQEQLATWAEPLRAHLQADLVGGRQRYVLLKLLTLLHDVGKPVTRSIDEAGDIHFYEHERVGAKMVTGFLRRLHFGTREVKIGHTVTLHHMRPKWLAQADKVTPRAFYRFFRDTRDSGVDVTLLSLADTLAKSDAPSKASLRRQLEITERLLEVWFQRRDSIVEPPALVRGGEIIETFSLEPGPIVGEVLEAIREAQVASEISTRAEALTFARDWLASNDR